MTALAHHYRYLEPSALSATPKGAELCLATCGAAGEHPHFFRGQMREPRLIADLLLTLMTVVRTHFWQPRPVLLDPVVTASESCLRFEGFSGCCGVYARVDVAAEAFDAEIHGRGTTNVDFNDPMRVALSRLRDDEYVGLAVGRDGVELERAGAKVLEKPVRLPTRWLKGFSEVQAYQPGLRLRHECSGAQARQFLRDLPGRGADRGYVMADPSGLRLSTMPSAGRVPVGGIRRLRVLEPVAGRIRGLRLWADADAGTTGWELEFNQARLFLMLSPELKRGFSGEGQALDTLAGGDWEAALARVRAELHWQAELDPAAIAVRTGLAVAQVSAALTALGTRGLAGFDVSTQRFFHRELPFALDRVETLQPRLVDARQLVAEGKVTAVPNLPEGRLEFTVQGLEVRHYVRLLEAGDKCSCPWFSRHQGQRGPCKHILAARIAAGRD
jgi:predicted nucleic acid-binding Zn finger protein